MQLLSRFSISTVVLPSNDALGSSKNNISGSVINARASANFCFSPPDNLVAEMCMISFKPIFSTHSVANLCAFEFETFRSKSG